MAIVGAFLSGSAALFFALFAGYATAMEQSDEVVISSLAAMILMSLAIGLASLHGRWSSK